MKKLWPAFVLTLLLFLLLASPVLATYGPGIGQAAAITVQAATDITPYSAVLHADLTWPVYTLNNQESRLRPVNDGPELTVNGEPNSMVYFRYGTSSGALTSSTNEIAVTHGQASVAAEILGLYPCTTYYYQAFFRLPVIMFKYEGTPAGYLVALASANGSDVVSGLGVGLNRLIPDRHLNFQENEVKSSNILSFKTTGCVINTPSHNASGSGLGNSGVGLSNITVQSATLSAARVAPGENVDITATVANKGTVNGESKITLYINGEQVEAKGVAVSSGQSTPVHFSVSENEPGTYNVQVGGVSAGSFTVDAFNNNDILIYSIIGLFAIGIAGTLFLLARKRQA